MVFLATVPSLRDQLSWVPGGQTETLVCRVGPGSNSTVWTSHGYLTILITVVAKWFWKSSFRESGFLSETGASVVQFFNMVRG